jgi:hypothetical protein
VPADSPVSLQVVPLIVPLHPPLAIAVVGVQDDPVQRRTVYPVAG